MTPKELSRSWTMSSYNEKSKDQLDYFINENRCNVGSRAYLFEHATNKLQKLSIVKVICNLDDIAAYNALPEDTLLTGEDLYDADTSAEFISDNACYLVWFNYVD